MNSTQFASVVVLDSPAASFFLKDAVKKASERDVLDALRDAEVLLEFCQLRAKEAGLVTARDNMRGQLLTALKDLYDAVTDERADAAFVLAAQEAARAVIAKAEA